MKVENSWKFNPLIKYNEYVRTHQLSTFVSIDMLNIQRPLPSYGTNRLVQPPNVGGGKIFKKKKKKN